VIDFYAKKVQGEPFVSHILNQNPDLDMARVRRIQRQFWTAFKHATRKQGKGTEVERDDEELLGRFTDDQNDTALFIGWTDYARVTGTMPIEAQVHQAWFLAKHPDKLNPMHSKEPYERLFPEINSLSRAQQKQQLQKAIQWARRNSDVMGDPKTEQRPLMLGWAHVAESDTD
jgi:hypothetical protein